MERGWREMSPTCPRCGSSNTKFCYYNNYSLTQPRYFCKGCRRYWTKGGSLRNVPVGGGCRNSRRSRSSTLRLTTTPSNPTIFSNDHHHRRHHHHLGNLNNTTENSTTTPMNSEAPAIDLAVVYANFLNQKSDPINCGYTDTNPTLVELSSNIPDATKIAPDLQVGLQEHTRFVHCNDTDTDLDPSFAETALPMSELMSNVDNVAHQHQVLHVTQFSRPIILHEELSMQHEQLGLRPLTGEAFMSQEHHHHQQSSMPPWQSSSLNDANNNQLQDLESDSQISSMFNYGSWSPLHLPSFETSSSSSKP